MVRAIRLFEAQIAYDWTLAELAERLHLAPNYLGRLFKSATGLPPMAYLAHYRMETAAVLLGRTDQPVAQVGEAVGCTDQNYFARRFKAHYGLSPSTYRLRGVASRELPEMTTPNRRPARLWRGGAGEDDDVKAAWSVHPLDAVEFDVAGGRGAGDPGQRFGRIEAFEGVRQ